MGCGGSLEQSPFVKFALHSPEPIVVRIGYVPGIDTPPMMIEGWAKDQAPIPVADYVCNNIQKLFPHKTCIVPRTLDEMYPLTSLPSDKVYDDVKIWELAESMPGAITDTRIVVVDGYPALDPKPCQNNKSCILGRTTPKQEGRPAIALFLPNILSRATYLHGGYPLSLYAGYMFATLLVHEFGHGAGLVNLDVTMSFPHEDATMGNHCDNDSCVMAPDPLNRSALTWAKQRMTDGAAADSGFDENCIQDIRTASTY